MKWPDGKDIAIMLAFDVDGELLWLTRNDENRRHITNLSRGQYSCVQAMPRILRMLEDEQLKATFFFPAWNAEKYPEVAREVHRLGHEIGYHGWYHEAYDDYDKEKALMDKVDGIYQELLGEIPIGHRAPDGNVYDFDLRLWNERGYIYSSNWRNSDGPFIHELDGNRIPIVELPKDSIFDDTAYDFYTECTPQRAGLRSGREMCEVWRDEFDALRQEHRMINFVMHPQFIGRPGNLHALRELIHYMRDHGAWFATNEEVAQYVLAQEGVDPSIR